jgi:uncharacterized protein (DUF4415 family)
MITSKKLSDERIAEIKAFKNTDFSDCPILTEEQLKNLKPRHLKQHTTMQKSISVNLDDDILVWLQNFGTAYQVQVNGILRKVMLLQQKEKQQAVLSM